MSGQQEFIHTHTYTHTYIYIYIYIYMCVCVCVCECECVCLCLRVVVWGCVLYKQLVGGLFIHGNAIDVNHRNRVYIYIYI